MNVSRDEVKFSVKLAVIFRSYYHWKSVLILRFLAENDENNVVHPVDQLFMDLKLKTVVP